MEVSFYNDALSERRESPFIKTEIQRFQRLKIPGIYEAATFT